ncbi:MAG: hypothetical protein ACTS5A_04100, partial [Candidatus Hodgkinia cicadicola]
VISMSSITPAVIASRWILLMPLLLYSSSFSFGLTKLSGPRCRPPYFGKSWEDTGSFRPGANHSATEAVKEKYMHKNMHRIKQNFENSRVNTLTVHVDINYNFSYFERVQRLEFQG